MTVPWDQGEGHVVHLEVQVEDPLVEVVADIHEPLEDQQGGSQEDHQEVWGPVQGNHQGRVQAVEDHGEEWVVYLRELPDHSVYLACLPCSLEME